MRVLYKLMVRPGREPEVRKVAESVTEDQFAAWGLRGHLFFRGGAVYLFLDGEGDRDPVEALRGEAGAKKLVDALARDTPFDPGRPEVGRLRPWTPPAPREVTA